MNNSHGSSDFHTPEEDHLVSPTRTRKKLQLKPRSNRRVEAEPPALSPAAAASSAAAKKSNPFGAAKPREQVLRQRGIDVKSLDAKFEAKAKITKFTPEQEAQIESVRQELTHLETLWRDANEKELPEEVYRSQVQTKREELKTLMEQFASHKDSSSSATTTTTTTSGSGKPRTTKTTSNGDGFTTVVNKTTSAPKTTTTTTTTSRNKDGHATNVNAFRRGFGATTNSTN